jgi:hypothetical protein
MLLRRRNLRLERYSLGKRREEEKERESEREKRRAAGAKRVGVS